MRRLLACLFSMYFDDGTLQDWKQSAAGTQSRIKEFMAQLGSPWAEAKSQKAFTQGDFWDSSTTCPRFPRGG